MPAGKKRTAEDSKEHDTERAPKVSKTAKNGGNPKSKTDDKPKLTPTEFKEKALPLHVMLTHTPPTILKEGLIEEDGTEEKVPEGADAPSNDVGTVGTLTLIPSSFSTGSYGWKGNKRVTVELQAGEIGPDGTREKVQVMLTINATVLGSKPEKGAKGKAGKEEEEVEEDSENPEAPDTKSSADAAE